MSSQLHAAWRHVQDYVQRIEDHELADLHAHTLGGIRGMALSIAVLAPVGPIYVLVERVDPARGVVAAFIHLVFFSLVAHLSRTGFGRRHTNVLTVALAFGLIAGMTVGQAWVRHSVVEALFFTTIVPMVVGIFIPWRPLLTVLLAIPTIAAVLATHLLMKTPLGVPMDTFFNAGVCIAVASAIAIQGQRRLWQRFERTKRQLAAAESAAITRSVEAARREDDIRRLLDNIGDGFVKLGLDGRMSSFRSASLTRWLGEAEDGLCFSDYLTAADKSLGVWFALAWEQVVDGILPLDAALEQLPARASIGERTLALRYRPIFAQGSLSEVIVVISDVTSDVAKERAEAELHNLGSAMRSVLRDRSGFVDFVREGTALVHAIADEQEDARARFRHLHTLKGSASMFALDSVASLCHELESTQCLEPRPLSDEERRALFAVWGPIAALAGPVLEEGPLLDVDHAEHEEVVRRLRAGAPPNEIAERISSWRFEPASRRLTRLAERARRVALRLGKGPIEVVVRDRSLRLPKERLGPLWAAIVHAIRNAVDHGIETESERHLAGKRVPAVLRLETKTEGDEVVVVVADDGRGIDWAAIARRAAEHGLPHDTEHDLVEALFTDGVSSRSEVTETSGRGVGMRAVRQACEELGGQIRVESIDGRGTTLEIRLPRAGVEGSTRLAA